MKVSYNNNSLKSKRHLRRIIRQSIEQHDRERVAPKISSKYPGIEDSCEVISQTIGTYFDIPHPSTPIMTLERKNQHVNSHLDLFEKPNIIGFSERSTTVLPLKEDHHIFVSDIRNWILKNRNLLTHSSINGLLAISKKFGFDFPKDARTFLKTPTSCDMIKIEEGHYSHLGVEMGILNRLEGKTATFSDDKLLHMSLNVDGLPLSKSSKSQFWPILLSIDSSNKTISKLFIAGLYHGYKKPVDVNLFLREFITEFKILQTKGLLINGVRVFPRISKVICDAPAKSFLLCVKAHNAYSGCTKCTEEGDFLNGRMAYPGVSSALRTDSTFVQKCDETYHSTGRSSPLLDLNIGLVSQVPLDYMHSVCLGVMKKLMTFWVKGKKDVRMKDVHIKMVSDRLMEIKSFMPSEFARLPRTLDEMDRFKATEFRQLLLYTGPIVFKNTLTKQQYIHYMSLHCSILILCSPEFHLKYNDYAKELLVYFVQNFGKLYGFELISHNVQQYATENNTYEDSINLIAEGEANNNSKSPKENPECCDHGRILKDILDTTVAVRTILNEHRRILENIGNRPTTTNLESVPEKPFRSLKKLIQYDNSLRDSEDTAKQLETAYFIIGGDANNSIRRGLGKLLSNKLAMKCSFYGRKGNHPIKDMKCISILREALRKRFGLSYSDKDFQNTISQWLKQASLSHLREQKKF